MELLIRFYGLTGDAAFLTRVPEAIDWLDKLTLPPGHRGRAGPDPRATFIAIGTNKPLYVHRRGSNVVNGRSYVDDNPAEDARPLQRVPARGCRSPQAGSPRRPGQCPRRGNREAVPAAGAPPRTIPLPRFFALGTPSTAAAPRCDGQASTADGYWLVGAAQQQPPVSRRRIPEAVAAGDFWQAHVGDDSDTSPYRRRSHHGHLDRGLRPQHERADSSRSSVRVTTDAHGPRGARRRRGARRWRCRGSATTAGGPGRHRSSGWSTTSSGSAATRSRSWATRASSVAPAMPPWSSTAWTTAWSWHANPLLGLGRFTVEVDFDPAAGRTRRAAIPARAGGRTRRTARWSNCACGPTGSWALDTFLRSPAPGLTLLDRAQTRIAPDRWHTAALIYDGRTMTALRWTASARRAGSRWCSRRSTAGRTSLGMRHEPRVAFQGTDPAGSAVSCTEAGADADPAVARGRAGPPALMAAAERWEDGRVSATSTTRRLTYLAPAASGQPARRSIVVRPAAATRGWRWPTRRRAWPTRLSAAGRRRVRAQVPCSAEHRLPGVRLQDVLLKLRIGDRGR